MKTFNYKDKPDYSGYLTFRQLAKQLGIKENELREELIAMGILQKGTGSNYILTTPAVIADIGEVENRKHFNMVLKISHYNVDKVEQYLSGELTLNGYEPQLKL